MIYLYAVIRHTPVSLPAIDGFFQNPLKKMRIGELEAVYSDCERCDIDPNTTNLWSHEGVIEALMKIQCTLPVRFGTCFNNAEKLEDILRESESVLLADLERLQGCVELGLRILPPKRERKEDNGEHLSHTEGARLGSGKAFLEHRMALRNKELDWSQETNVWAGEVHSDLLLDALEGVQKIQVDPVPMITGAYLAKKEKLYPIQKRIGRLRQRFAPYHFVCTGPWPPYHFVSPILSASISAKHQPAE